MTGTKKEVPDLIYPDQAAPLGTVLCINIPDFSVKNGGISIVITKKEIDLVLFCLLSLGIAIFR